ncbi:hypothetical protein ADIAL_0906 [Alkalibacterium sp. AK22]|nr:hypothetical protein ADIAL_0906 [Alkalibacterium sp. AK22]
MFIIAGMYQAARPFTLVGDFRDNQLAETKVKVAGEGKAS